MRKNYKELSQIDVKKDMKKLEDKAREMGATTVFSAKEASDAFYYMSLEEIYQHIEDKEELLKQNKRYRELLKKIKEMTRYDDCREAEIYELVSDELEGESE